MIDETTALTIISRSAQLDIVIQPVTDAESERWASTNLILVRSKIKQIEAERVSWTKPLDEMKRRFMSKVSEYLTPLKETENRLTQELSRYRQKQEDIRLKEEARLLALHKARDERAAAKGKPSPLPETIIPYVAGAPKTIQTGAGSLTYTQTWKARIIDETKVPMFYGDIQLCFPSQAVLNTLARTSQGKAQVEGVIFELETGERIRQ